MNKIINHTLAVSSLISLMAIICFFLLLIYYSFTGHKFLIDEAQGFYVDQRGEEDFISGVMDSYVFSMIFKSYLFSIIMGLAPKFLIGTTVISYLFFFFVYLAVLIFMVIVGMITMKYKSLSAVIFSITTIVSLPLLLGIITGIIPLLLGILSWRLWKSHTILQPRTAI